MRRTSFLGALTVITLGGVLAFAIQSSPHDLDLHATGLIIMIAGIATLVIRFLLADSPLLGSQAADVAAVVEPLGEPVLDVFGNPISSTVPQTTLRPPPLEVPLYGPPVPMVASYAEDGEMLVGGGLVEGMPGSGAAPGYVTGPDETQLMAPVQQQPPTSLTPVYALTGRPVRVGRRRRRREG